MTNPTKESMEEARRLLSLLMLDTSMDVTESEVAEKHIINALDAAKAKSFDKGVEACSEYESMDFHSRVTNPYSEAPCP